jgi:hypothetical protein
MLPSAAAAAAFVVAVAAAVSCKLLAFAVESWGLGHHCHHWQLVEGQRRLPLPLPVVVVEAFVSFAPLSFSSVPFSASVSSPLPFGVV